MTDFDRSELNRLARRLRDEAQELALLTTEGVHVRKAQFGTVGALKGIADQLEMMARTRGEAL